MKLNTKVTLFVLGATMFAAVALAQTGPQALRFNKPIRSVQQAQAVSKGAKIAMACTKCKTVQLRDVDKKGAFLAWFTPKTRHVCPGCGGTWQYVNVAKGTRGGYTHTCSKCGDKSIFCCATRLGKKTPGMLSSRVAKSL